jgi:hypothetical protein
LFSLLFLGLHSAVVNAAEPDTNFQYNLIDQVDGKILDLKDNRILFLDSSHALKIKDRSSGNITTIIEGKNPLAGYSFLSPKGAIFLEQTGDVSTKVLYEWRDGKLVSLGKVSRSLIVKGNYAVFSDPGSSIYLRDLTNGENKLVTSDAYYGYDVAENGLVVWGGKDFLIYMLSDGKAVRVTDAQESYRFTFPLTDGINVVYKAGSAKYRSYGVRWSAVGTPPINLPPVFSTSPIDDLSPYLNYQINNGYIAFNYFDDGFYTSGLAIIYPDWSGRTVKDDFVALGPQGDILGYNKYYQYDPDLAFTLPFSYAKMAFWIGSETFIADGGKLYALYFDSDNTPPVTTANEIPLYSKIPVTVTLTATDDMSGVEGTFYRLNEGDAQPGSTLTLSNEGSYHLEYWSVDKSGNIETHRSKYFTIDKTAPVTKYTATSVYGTDKPAKYIKGYTLTLTATDVLSGVKETFYRINKGAWILYQQPIQLSGQGDQQIDFYSVDNAGNAEAHLS